eukprot:1656789-Heterocapsa_arctica.AAC.1
MAADERTTRKMYDKELIAFEIWLSDHSYTNLQELALTADALDDRISEYLQHLWDLGKPKSISGTLLSG